jgi:GxxExxY protein
MKIQIPTHLEQITERVIRAAYDVSNELGHGFLEGVYQKALAYQMFLSGMRAQHEVPYDIRYRGQFVGRYIADLVVEELVIVELKAIEGLTASHSGQVLNYLRASGLSVGLLLNFGKPRLEIKRILA